ncbi:hypothetical protein H0H81_011756 [Sphagnurus paluster]|uniref:Uncharacterized protein n=1 Tax=Sphagnurus paluster TaxID=117069 RepID=A0A9P7FNG0_9AGAR|nr:hypothetical protein H0H81_011756 [Sphagnurus paluster]
MVTCNEFLWNGLSEDDKKYLANFDVNDGKQFFYILSLLGGLTESLHLGVALWRARFHSWPRKDSLVQFWDNKVPAPVQDCLDCLLSLRPKMRQPTAEEMALSDVSAEQLDECFSRLRLDDSEVSQ